LAEEGYLFSAFDIVVAGDDLFVHGNDIDWIVRDVGFARHQRGGAELIGGIFGGYLLARLGSVLMQLGAQLLDLVCGLTSGLSNPLLVHLRFGHLRRWRSRRTWLWTEV